MGFFHAGKTGVKQIKVQVELPVTSEEIVHSEYHTNDNESLQRYGTQEGVQTMSKMSRRHDSGAFVIIGYNIKSSFASR